MLLAPLRSEGRVIGVVVLSRLGLDRFSDDELRLLVVLADQAAVAIGERTPAGRARPPRHGAGGPARHQPGRGGATMSEDPGGILAEQAARAAGMDSCLIWRWDQPSGDLVAIGAAGRPLEGCRAIWRFDRRPARSSSLTSRSGSTPVSSDEPVEHDRLARSGRPRCLVPISTAGRVVGMAELARARTGRHFHAGEIAWSHDGEPGRRRARERQPRAPAARRGRDRITVGRASTTIATCRTASARRRRGPRRSGSP